VARTNKPSDQSAHQKPSDAGTSLLTTPLDDPRAERARRTAMQSYIQGRITYAQALDRVRKAIERYRTAA
jgi:hypothetical protein